MSEIYNRIRARRLELGLTVEELANRMGYKDKSSISKIENGKADIPQSKVVAFARALNTTTAYLIGVDDAKERPVAIPPGFQPLPEMTMVPLVGDIACGFPITAEENIKSYVSVPSFWKADFALECHGDSMAPKICDGDIVCIRKQPTVDPGQIAAVRIDEEATLKRFYQNGSVVQLIAENAAYPPMVFTGADLNRIHIEGLVVGFCRGLLEQKY